MGGLQFSYDCSYAFNSESRGDFHFFGLNEGVARRKRRQKKMSWDITMESGGKFTIWFNWVSKPVSTKISWSSSRAHLLPVHLPSLSHTPLFQPRTQKHFAFTNSASKLCAGERRYDQSSPKPRGPAYAAVSPLGQKSCHEKGQLLCFWIVRYKTDHSCVQKSS